MCTCIVSFHPCRALFASMQEVIHSRRKFGKSQVFVFLKALLALPFPEPGARFVVRCPAVSKDDCGEYTFFRAADSDTMLAYVGARENVRERACMDQEGSGRGRETITLVSGGGGGGDVAGRRSPLKRRKKRLAGGVDRLCVV
jgi:hypothetical protein